MNAVYVGMNVKLNEYLCVSKRMNPRMRRNRRCGVGSPIIRLRPSAVLVT